jgi:penicillin-binding protein 1C
VEAVTGRPRIDSPVNGAIYAIDPDIPRDRQRIVLTARGALQGARFVLDDGRRVSADAPFLWLPQPGSRQIVLVNAVGKELDHVRFEVRGLRPARVVNARTGKKSATADERG